MYSCLGVILKVKKVHQITSGQKITRKKLHDHHKVLLHMNIFAQIIPKSFVSALELIKWTL